MERQRTVHAVALAAIVMAGSLGAAQPGVVYNGPVLNVQSGNAPVWDQEEMQRRRVQAPPPAVLPEAIPAPVQAVRPPRELRYSNPDTDPNERGLSLGGPRFGFSYMSGDGFDKLVESVRKAKPGADVEPGMSQFGWQAEYRFYRNDHGLTALMEFIPLVGGLDQGLALPSLTWLLGLRGRSGLEFGVGPAVGLNGAGLMLGAGYTMELGGINIPFNVAVGRGSYQTTSFAVSTGFNL